MPRDSNGNYVLPPGNPVVGGTAIEAAGWGVPTMDDLGNELTNSLDRNGRGGMLVPFRNFSGNIGSPGITFIDEISAGIYRSATNDFRWAIAGVDIVRWVSDPAPVGEKNPFQVWNGAEFKNVLVDGYVGGVTFNGNLVITTPNEPTISIINTTIADTLNIGMNEGNQAAIYQVLGVRGHRFISNTTDPTFDIDALGNVTIFHGALNLNSTVDVSSTFTSTTPNSLLVFVDGVSSAFGLFIGSQGDNLVLGRRGVQNDLTITPQGNVQLAESLFLNTGKVLFFDDVFGSSIQDAAGVLAIAGRLATTLSANGFVGVTLVQTGNFILSGSAYTFGSIANTSSTLRFVSNTVSFQQMIFHDGADAGLIAYNHTFDQMEFRTNGVAVNNMILSDTGLNSLVGIQSTGFVNVLGIDTAYIRAAAANNFQAGLIIANGSLTPHWGILENLGPAGEASTFFIHNYTLGVNVMNVNPGNNAVSFPSGAIDVYAGPLDTTASFFSDNIGGNNRVVIGALGTGAAGARRYAINARTVAVSELNIQALDDNGVGQRDIVQFNHAGGMTVPATFRLGGLAGAGIRSVVVDPTGLFGIGGVPYTQTTLFIGNVTAGNVALSQPITNFDMISVVANGGATLRAVLTVFRATIPVGGGVAEYQLQVDNAAFSRFRFTAVSVISVTSGTPSGIVEVYGVKFN